MVLSMYKYGSPSFSTWDVFGDPQSVPETTGSTELCVSMYTVFSLHVYTYGKV